MIAFMNDTAIGGYEKLLETSESYQHNVGNMNEMMQRFASESKQLKINMNEIKNALEEVKIAAGESASGAMHVTEMAVKLTGNVGDIEKEADSNLGIVEKLNQEIGKFRL